MAHSPSSNDRCEPDFEKGSGLIPVVVQEVETGVVLMLAYMNREAYDQTLATGQAVYFSRSRGGLWRKGETSGNVQQVKQIRIDCDRDTVATCGRTSWRSRLPRRLPKLASFDRGRTTTGR